MEPITVAVLTAAVTTLGNEVTAGVATAAGKSLWERINKLFAWKREPDPSQIAATVAEILIKDIRVRSELERLFLEFDAEFSSKVGRSIQTKVYNERTDVSGDLNINVK